MASKRKVKQATKKGGSVASMAVSAAKSVASKVMGSKQKGTGKKRRKHGLAWYVKETARLKAKKKYDKEKLNIR